MIECTCGLQFEVDYTHLINVVEVLMGLVPQCPNCRKTFYDQIQVEDYAKLAEEILGS